MATGEPTDQAISQEELSALAKTSRTFSDLLFMPPLALDELNLSQARFDRCLFRIPAIRSADFSQAAFKDCRFEPTRFFSCRFADAQLHGCSLFDLQQKKGCTFALCGMQAVESAKCNFATSSFERSALTKAHFDRCNLSFADLSGLQLQNGEFLSCRFSEASFIGTDLSNATMIACALDRVEWDRARLREADLRGSRLAGLNLAVLADYAGLSISESEQSALLEQLGVSVHPGT